MWDVSKTVPRFVDFFANILLNVQSYWYDYLSPRVVEIILNTVKHQGQEFLTVVYSALQCVKYLSLDLTLRQRLSSGGIRFHRVKT
ncbi:unknown protein [Microcystis aeruginosa NIES-843]|uniref:Uncharacterized protein n=1 Tax=Microcystis aeruginosa (strain NIES-843 / IAM M-2473) TaxID=449447 RepID=B0JGH7_MICAN|nr:unknown protein [Microcystis aeruginosa NIES-843]